MCYNNLFHQITSKIADIDMRPENIEHLTKVLLNVKLMAYTDILRGPTPPG